MVHFRPAKRRLKASLGESVRILRELQGLSQNQLAERISIVEGDALAIRADVLVVKYAQALYGVDELVVERLHAAGEGVRERVPEPGGFRLIDAHDQLGSKKVLFVGVVTLRKFGYEAIREFARRALASLAGALPTASHVALTLHGRRFGLSLQAF
jgi:transcriptional regulator with XRE-family HTH domain